MIPVLPPCRCYEKFEECSSFDCKIIKKMFILQKDHDLRKLTLEEIKELIKDMD